MKIKLIDLVFQEYFAIVDHLKNTIPPSENKIIVNSHLFYAFLDKNLYIKRNQKLEIYRQLNLISCNSKGFSSVIYDKELKKSKRKIILNLSTYETIKNLYQTKFDC